jgi:hypothetical protein
MLVEREHGVCRKERLVDWTTSWTAVQSVRHAVGIIDGRFYRAIDFDKITVAATITKSSQMILHYCCQPSRRVCASQYTTLLVSMVRMAGRLMEVSWSINNSNNNDDDGGSGDVADDEWTFFFHDSPPPSLCDLHWVRSMEHQQHQHSQHKAAIRGMRE